MPMLTPWEAAYEVGDPLIDAQHRALLSLCDVLGARCQAAEGDGATAAEDADPVFDRTFDSLKSLARGHFEVEAERLAPLGDEALEDHRFECDEFEYLVEQIATTENFTRVEIQRFLALWCLGHVRSAIDQHVALTLALARERALGQRG